MTVINHHVITRKTAASARLAERTIGDYLPMIVAAFSGTVGGAVVLAIMHAPVIY